MAKQNSSSGVVQRNQRRGLAAGPLFLAFALQAGLLVAAFLWVIPLAMKPGETEFEIQPAHPAVASQPQREWALQEIQSAASRANRMKPMAVNTPQHQSLPALPVLPAEVFDPLGRSDGLSSRLALARQSALFDGLESINTLGSLTSFFGIEDQGRRILLMLDDGGSVLNKAVRSGVPLERIQEEAITVIEGLDANTSFGIVRFVRSIDTFRGTMLPATQANKALAVAWIQSRFGKRSMTSALPHQMSGIQGALEVGFQLRPEVIFLMSDGDFQRTAIHPSGSSYGQQVPFDELEASLDQLQAGLAAPARLHFVGFEVEPAHEAAMRQVTTRNGGKFRSMGSSD